MTAWMWFGACILFAIYIIQTARLAKGTWDVIKFGKESAWKLPQDIPLTAVALVSVSGIIFGDPVVGDTAQDMAKKLHVVFVAIFCLFSLVYVYVSNRVGKRTA